MTHQPHTNHTPTTHQPHTNHTPTTYTTTHTTTHTTAPTAATLCVGGGPHRGRRGTKSRSAPLSTARHSHLWGARNAPRVLGSTSMTGARVEVSTAGLGQTLRAGRPLVGSARVRVFSVVGSAWRAAGVWRNQPERLLGGVLRNLSNSPSGRPQLSGFHDLSV